MSTEKPGGVGGQNARKRRKRRSVAEQTRMRERRIQLAWYETRRFALSIRAPKTTPEYTYPEERVLERGYPEQNDPAFVAALHQLNAAHRLDTEQAQRVAIWLALSGWQLRRAREAQDDLFRRRGTARTGVSMEEWNAIRAGCRRELIAWTDHEFHAKRDYDWAVAAWQALTGAKRRKKQTPDRAARIAHRQPSTPAFPKVRGLWDMRREIFIRDALLLHFRTGAEGLAVRGVDVPQMTAGDANNTPSPALPRRNTGKGERQDRA